jgi:RNA polymerase sigma-70 factor (ECF subfamily)
MVSIGGNPAGGTEVLIGRIKGGEAEALPELFARRRKRLRRMVRLRLDQRLQGRVDPEDVLDQAFRDVLQHARDYLAGPKVSPFVWLRQLTNRRLTDMQRRLFESAPPDIGQDISLVQGPLPQVSSVSLAAMLMGQFSRPVHDAQHVAKQMRLQEALKEMRPVDREVLVLRHFEMLDNDETAEVLGLPRSEVSRHYLRALKLIKEFMSDMPGLPS